MSDIEMDGSPEQIGDGATELGSKESAADLKSKLHGEGDVLNHIDQNSQNGYTNHIEAKPKDSSKHRSDSKHKEHRKEHRDKDRERDRDKDKHSSSSSKHKDGSSSSSSDKHKHSSSSSSKHGSSSSSSKHHSSSSSSSKHREGGSGSSSSHKHSSSSSSKKEGHSSSSSSKPKEGGSSSSPSKDKHHSSSSKDKHSSSSDKHKHSSSSSSHKSGEKKESSSKEHRDKDKERSERKEKEKEHRDKERKDKEHRDKERKDKDKHRSKESSSSSKHKESSSSGSKLKENIPDAVKMANMNGAGDELPLSVKEEPGSPAKRTRSSSSPEKSPMKLKVEPQSDDDEDDTPLSMRLKQETEEKPAKRRLEESDDDDEPLSARMEKAKKVKKETPEKVAKKRKADESEDEKPLKKKKKKVKEEPKGTPKKKGKKEEEQEVWKWWEEEKKDDGVKWSFLEHKGPVFAPPYDPLPSHVKFYYDGKPMKLEMETEEVAGFYGKMLEHEYTTKDVFNTNFFKDWRKVMSQKEKETITDLKKCNFREICEYYKEVSEQRKNRSKEEKLKLKEENEAIMKEHGFCIMDGHKEKIGNFRIEPPGLFRGRGNHPKQGMLKRRTQPESIIINCSKDSKIPEPPAGHKWKRVQHDHQVTWLASWNENIQNQTKYIMLNPASRLKGQKDWQKYETARKLHKCVDKIRANYQEDWRSKEMRIRQRSVALYFIDKLALRAGNEKDEGETADTVGCCSLRVEHLTLHDTKDGRDNVVEFDFLGKDSIRYQNAIPVEKRVYKNLQMFMDNKQPGDDLFDRLNTVILNKHLHDLMEGLTAKVFRTYNASRTLQEQLDLLTNPEDPVAAKMLSYNRANRAVAVLCNHQRAAPKNFSKQMENLMAKIKDKRTQVKEAKKQLKAAKGNYKAAKNQSNKMVFEKKKKAVDRLEEQLTKLEVQATDKDENKEIALGTSKLNYLDPRISVAWCKKWEVPVEKIYNKTQRDKFRWAIDMVDEDFKF